MLRMKTVTPGKRKRRVIALVLFGGCALAITWCFLPTRSRHPALDEFLRAQRLADAGRRNSLLRVIPLKTRLRLAQFLDKKSMEKRAKLYQSDELESIMFYAPDLPERKARLSEQQLGVLSSRRFIEVASSDQDTVALRCLPEMVSDLQHRFCYVTNYIPRSALTRLSFFNSEGTACCLPDGTEVDVAAGQKWLNESVAAGWRVGISRRGVTQLLIVTREHGSLSRTTSRGTE